MMNRILITGGSGLVGQYLTEYLISKGYRISILSRGLHENTPNINYFLWDTEQNSIDKTCLYKVQTIIHLAGENVGEKKWTSERKKRILDSRTKSTDLLFDLLKNESHNVKNFISSSAVGIYGSELTENTHAENSAFGSDFLANVCVEWEKCVNQMNLIGIRTISLRTGMVLANNGGALSKMLVPFKFGLGSSLGSGKQFVPWIHIIDLCRMFLFCIDNPSLIGPFNAVVGDSLRNQELSESLAKALRKPFFMPNIPKSILKLFFGEMSSIVTEGSQVSSEKIKKSGFEFKFPKIETALNDLLN